jgi:hypothetical protein
VRDLRRKRTVYVKIEPPEGGGTMRKSAAIFIFLCLVFSAPLRGQETNADKDSQVKAVDQPVTVKPESKTRVRFGGFSAGGYYSSSRYWYPYGYPYGSPFWYPYYYPFSYAASVGWSPYWWGYYPSMYPSSFWMDSSQNSGKVKIESARDDAELFIDGAYAGFLKELKTLSLAPGAYNLEIRVPDKKPYVKRIYVLTGKTINLAPTFEPLPEVVP